MFALSLLIEKKGLALSNFVIKCSDDLLLVNCESFDLLILIDSDPVIVSKQFLLQQMEKHSSLEISSGQSVYARTRKTEKKAEIYSI